MKTIEVVAAIIINEGKILCVQRNINKYEYISKKFEFPGGKIETGETKEETIKREIKEELEMKIEIQEYLTVEHEYPDFRLIMHSFICTCKNTSLVLTEHIDYRWLLKNELASLDWAAADLPIVEELLKTEL